MSAKFLLSWGVSSVSLFNLEIDLENVLMEYSVMLDLSIKSTSALLGIVTTEKQHLKNLRGFLKKSGIQNSSYELPGIAHEWLTWHRYLHKFAPMQIINSTNNYI